MTGQITKIFVSHKRIASKLRKLLDELATGVSRLGESRDKSRKTLTPVFQHKTCLNNEKQSKH